MPKIVIPGRDAPELESDVLRDVRKWLMQQPDIVVHRNNVGSASMTTEDFVRAGLDYEAAKVASSVVQARFRGMRFGLSVGSSDLIGSITVRWCRTGLSSEGRLIVCAPRSIPMAIELKQPGKRPTDDQTRFIESKRDIHWAAYWADNLTDVQNTTAAIRRGDKLWAI